MGKSAQLGLHTWLPDAMEGAGSVIHAVGDEQDIRKLGGLKNLLPLSFMAFLVGSFALT
eukprot:gene18684-18983_t